MNRMSVALMAAIICMTSATAAYADFPAPPPLPPPSPPPTPPTPTPSPSPTPSSNTSSSQGDSGGHRAKITGESVMLWQGISIGCTAIVLIGHSQIKAGGKRELTPLEAIDDGAKCTFIPAMAISAFSHLSGMEDSACSYDVARRAFRENNTPRAKEELLWGRDGSDHLWAIRQAKFNGEYFDCYHGLAKAKHLIKKHRSAHRAHRRHARHLRIPMPRHRPS